MPPAIPEYLPPKKKRIVDVPMRKFPFGSNSLNPRDISQDSFWAKVHEEKLASDKILAQLKERFATKTTTISQDSKAGGLQLKKAKQPQIVQDEKILQALGILQGSAKLSHKEWHRAILEIDEKVLTAGLVQQLRAALPPMEMLNKFKEADKAMLDEMPEGELFVAQLAQINALPLRLDNIIFKMRLPEILSDLKKVSSVIEACESIRRSKGFKTFLELALLFGNFMGQSSKAHKDVFGFEMSVLPKIADTKDIENHRTLLHYMVETMRKMDSSLAKFAQEDLYHCAAASRINSDEIQKGVSSLKQAVTKLDNTLKTYKKQSEKDRFVDVMAPFLQKAQAEFDVVETLHNKMKNDWMAITKFYCFDPKKYTMEQFFGDLKAFKEQYEGAYRDLEAAEKEKEKKKTKKEKQRPPLSAIQPPHQTPSRFQTDPKRAGVLDELEKVMNSEDLNKFLLGSRTPKAPGLAGRTRRGQAALNRNRASEERISFADDQPRIRRIRTRGGPTQEVIVPPSQPVRVSPSSKENHDVGSSSLAPSSLSTAELLARLNQF